MLSGWKQPVYEYAPLGNLRDYLLSKKEGPPYENVLTARSDNDNILYENVGLKGQRNSMTLRNLWGFALDAARALEFLHSCKVRHFTI